MQISELETDYKQKNYANLLVKSLNLLSNLLESKNDKTKIPEATVSNPPPPLTERISIAYIERKS